MAASVCTLFEKHFHKGVPGLINSLYKNGFRGDFYAGYRGPLPKWSENATDNPDLGWAGAKTMRVANDLCLHFIPVTTEYHLAHYKPAFMLNLFKGPAKAVDALAYFDPDIVNLCRWGFYEKWMSYGVAMVHEVVSNDMPATHPSRMEWYHIIKKINRQPQRMINSYINAGFCGVAAANKEFLKVWIQVIEVAIKEYNMDAATFIEYDRTSAFYSIDQDAFNIAAMCCDSPISEMGPEAMGFVNSGWTMSHSTGSPKPWTNKFILSALKGNPPSRPHKDYWSNISEPISLYSSSYVSLKKLEIILASLIGRFYSRN
ncbi:hypothetical protein [Pontibacter virosus]|uniref:Uncharacterized protein n=1 Tax=Pontibacter virosus TaxID=1765052 RepID=A0A2U1AQH7_9BACT|nr:hypothetical protein [Pontibacter virosus]PVY38680.1 hypothetical protein C8E01_11517 [Pontibacter virosus]